MEPLSNQTHLPSLLPCVTVDYNEHGHAIYDDGSTSADAADAADAQKDVPPPPDVNEAEPSEGSWEESFGGHTDTKPNGPQSVGMDITFNSKKTNNQILCTVFDGVY